MAEQTKTVKDIQTLLKFTYGIIPIVAGADKFANLLTDWSHYLNPRLVNTLPFSTQIFMMIIGIIEIFAGLLVFINTQKGAYLVSAWLVLIAINLITSGSYLDVAVRDLVMAIGAFALAKLSGVTEMS